MDKATKKSVIFIKLTVFSILLFILLLYANKILMLKDGTSKYSLFYEENTPFDILFFGSSRVLDAFQPMELWDEYGIKSYNMAQHSEGLARDYWQLKNALEHNTPRLVVMDVSMFYGTYMVSEDDQESRAYLHKQIDHMPMSITKLAAVNDMVPKSICAEYIFPFILYHSRWNQISRSDFISSGDIRLGAEVRSNIMSQEKIPWTDESLAEVFIPESVKLEDILQLCAEKNVAILFICMPCNENAAVFSTLNHFEKYFSEKNVRYLNIAKTEDFLDYNLDFSDESHVNVAGSIKISNYIGEYFAKNFGVKNNDEKTEKRWNNMLADYKVYKEQLICMSNGSPKDFLLFSYADNDYVIITRGNKEAYERNDMNMFLPYIELTEDELLEIEIYRKGEAEPFAIYKENNNMDI